MSQHVYGSTPVLLGFPVSPYVRAARIGFAEKSVEVTLTEIGMDHLATPAYRAINPLGKMPALTHGDLNLFETPALLVYANAIGSGPSLEPEDPGARARMWTFLGVAQHRLYPDAVMGVYFHRVLAGMFGVEGDGAKAEAAAVALEVPLDLMEQSLGDGFLVGGALSLADLLCGVMIDYLARTQDGAKLLETRPKLTAWLESLRARPSFVSTFPVVLGKAAG